MMKSLHKIFLFTVLLAGISQLSYATENNNDGILADQKIHFIQCYPNPAFASINFETNNLSERNFVLTIYNFIGKKVDEIKINSSKINISLENYFRGLYVYQLRDKQGQLIESGKFQVIK